MSRRASIWGVGIVVVILIGSLGVAIAVRSSSPSRPYVLPPGPATNPVAYWYGTPGSMAGSTSLLRDEDPTVYTTRFEGRSGRTVSLVVTRSDRGSSRDVVESRGDATIIDSFNDIGSFRDVVIACRPSGPVVVAEHDDRTVSLAFPPMQEEEIATCDGPDRSWLELTDAMHSLRFVDLAGWNAYVESTSFEPGVR